MSIKTSKVDILWSYFGYSLNLVSGILILPLILTKLRPNELGLWYSFLGVASFVSLLDFGFAPTIARNISYSYSGAQKLLKKGISLEKEHITDKPNFQLLKQVFIVSKRIYLLIAFIALSIMLSAGTYYIKIISKNILEYDFLIAWFIFSLAVFFNLYYSYWNPVLRGIGAIKEDQKANVIAKAFQLLVSVVGLFMFRNIIVLSAAYLVNGLVFRVVSKSFFLQRMINENQPTFLKDIKEIPAAEVKDTFSLIWFNTWRIGLVCVGGFLITNANTLICSYYLGLEITAQYGLALQIFAIISGISSILASSYLPEVNRAIVNNDKNKIVEIISFSTFVLWIFFILGSLCFIIFGEFIISLFSSKYHFLPWYVLAFISIYLLLEANHSTFATFIASSNIIPFVLPALLSGAAVIILSVFFLSFYKPSLWAILIPQFVVQLSYNNWKWPLIVMKQYSITPIIILKKSSKIIKLKLV